MSIMTIAWKNGAIRIIDQACLPGKLRYIQIDDLKSLWKAIRELKVRGAPALGAAAALGVVLGSQKIRTDDFEVFERKLQDIITYIGSSRPTARNLFWALEQMHRVALKNRHKPVAEIKEALFCHAQGIIELDRLTCRKMGEYGNRLVNDRDRILTICNTGALATIDYGTALGVVFRAAEQKKRIQVFACETRPLLQGARLTTWELKRKKIPVTLLCDNMACALMGEGKIDKVFTGADRIAANGDTANKIGTYNLAVVSRYHKIPFYVVAPGSTFDLKITSGRHIKIEQRDPKEVTESIFKKPMAVKGVKVYNPAFDVTPAELITAIITDQGIIYPPFKKNIARLFSPLSMVHSP